MKKVTVGGKMENFFGQTVKPALSYEGEFTAFETADECKSAGEWPNDKAVLKFVNDKRKATARQAAMNAAAEAAGYKKPTLEDSDLMQLRNIYRTLIAAGRSEQEARDGAAAALGKEWPEDSE